MPKHTKRFRSLTLSWALLLLAAVAQADHEPGEYDDEHDHDRARHALERGEVRPFVEILERVATQMPGEIVEVELERWHARGERRWAYELVVISPDGRLREIYVDAATAEILGEEYEEYQEHEEYED
ncbi:MAG: PepSY domain-containing protein [Halieaceae bacterium]|nr:PepSY domain-containing protein [Halieaceae bacterium]